MTLQINNPVDSGRAEQDCVETIVLKQDWLVYLSQTVGHSVSLVLVRTTKLSECIVLEARNENIAVLKVMETKLRECLRGMNDTHAYKEAQTQRDAHSL